VKVAAVRFLVWNHAVRLAIEIAGFLGASKVTASPRLGLPGHREAAADLRKIVCKEAREIILNMTLQVSRL
jgi:hypothetical protein